jgi:CTP:molybdopterin cytidylyltransferase MocA
MDQIGALVLAAGQSQRFGSPKLLAGFRGRPLVSHVLDIVNGATRLGLVAEACAVVPADNDQLRSLAKQAGLLPVSNEHPALGISHSLRLGLGALVECGGERLGAAIVLLGDQPLVRLDALRLLIEGWRNGQGRMLRPRYSDSLQVPGHPVLLDRSLWDLADLITGDRGLGASLGDELKCVLLDIPGANPDIDSPADLRTLEDLNS